MRKRYWHFNIDTKDRLLSVGFPLLLLLLWEMAVALQWLDARFFPAPSHVAIALWNLIVKGELLGRLWLLPEKIRTGDCAATLKVMQEGHLWVSLFRIFSGFLLGAVGFAT